MPWAYLNENRFLEHMFCSKKSKSSAFNFKLVSRMKKAEGGKSSFCPMCKVV